MEAIRDFFQDLGLCHARLLRVWATHEGFIQVAFIIGDAYAESPLILLDGPTAKTLSIQLTSAAYTQRSWSNGWRMDAPPKVWDI